MERERAIQLLIAGEKMLEVSDGAAKTWEAIRAGKTFSQAMGDSLIGVENIAGRKAAMALFTACAGVIGIPAIFRIMKG